MWKLLKRLDRWKITEPSLWQVGTDYRKTDRHLVKESRLLLPPVAEIQGAKLFAIASLTPHYFLDFLGNRFE